MGIKEEAGEAALAEIKRRYPHAKKVTISLTDIDDESGKRAVRVSATVDGEHVKLDA